MRRDDFLALGFFQSVPRCNYRLHQLVHGGYLRRIESVNGVRCQQLLYAPSASAIPLLRSELDLPPDELARICRTDTGPQAIEHSLRILDVRVRLLRETDSGSVKLKEWLCEPECLHQFEVQSPLDGRRSSTLVKPDAYFRLECEGCRVDCFLEVDLGNVSLPRYRQKLRRYGRYLVSGAFKDIYHADRFSVVTITIGERRASHLARIKTDHLDHLVTTWPRINRSSLFDSIWIRGTNPAMSLLKTQCNGRRKSA